MIDTTKENLPYRPNVCIILVNRENRIFLGERNLEQGIWQFPQGGAEPDLSLEENVLKELHEELGVDPEYLSIEKKLNATHTYDFLKTPEYAVGRWRGQAQTFWLATFIGVDSAINIRRFQPEFMNWRWATPDQVKILADPKRLPGYAAPLLEIEEWIKKGGYGQRL